MNMRIRWLVLCLTVFAANGFAADETQSLVASARELVSDTLHHDAAGVAKLLDPNFMWIDANGRAFTRAEVAAKPPAPILGDSQGDASPRTHLYGLVGTVEQARDRVYVLQVWVKRSSGWRALIYHEVQAQPAPLAPGAEATASSDCVNPCKEVPFRPANQTEREVIESYQAVERAVTAHDPQAWGVHIADEFFAVTSNSDKPLDKAARMAGLAKQQQGGIAPFPLLSAKVFVFGDTAVMASKQQPVNGPPFRVTRVWIRRGGRWVESISYQTTAKAS